jgi:hypothetical protein
MKRTFKEITRDLSAQKSANSMATIENEDEMMLALEDLYKELKDKEDGVYWLYKKSESEIKMYQEQADKILKHVGQMKRAQEKLKSFVIHSHTSAGELPSQSVFNPIKIRESAGSVDVIDEEQIPEEYFVTVETKKLNKKELLKKLKEGNDVRGVRLKVKSFVNGLK